MWLFKHEKVIFILHLISVSSFSLFFFATMTLRISQAIIVISGAVTGLAAIAALSYFGQRNDAPIDTTATATGRLRRSRHVRIRRGNNRNTTENTTNTENEQIAAVSENEEDADNGKMLSLFKEWSDDDNRNLINLLAAISDNQSRKGKSCTGRKK